MQDLFLFLCNKLIPRPNCFKNKYVFISLHAKKETILAFVGNKCSTSKALLWLHIYWPSILLLFNVVQTFEKKPTNPHLNHLQFRVL